MSEPTQEVKVDHKTVYPPSPEVIARARISDWDAVSKAAGDNPQAFWAERAAELEWYQEWDQVLDDSNAPFFKWFAGGKTNIVQNALDRHVSMWRKNKAAYIWQGEDGSERNVE